MASNAAPLNIMPADSAGQSGDNEPIGAKVSGYAGPENGPFNCGNCTHFDGQGSCNNPTVQSDPEVNGKVEAEGCCTYFRNGQAQAEPDADDQGAATELSQGARFPKPAAGMGGY